METISIEYTKIKYPNIFKRGVVAIHTVMKRGIVYQIYERANGKMDKPKIAFYGWESLSWFTRKSRNNWVNKDMQKPSGGYRPGSGRKPLGKKMLTTRIDEEIIQDLKEYSESTGIPQAVIIEDALKNYLKKMTNKLEKRFAKSSLRV